jgi:hypothetical protein
MEDCLFGKKISKEGLDDFSKKFLKIQIDESYEELGDQLIEDPEQIIELAGYSADKLGHDQILYQSRAIIGCLQARYLGLCATKGCKYGKKVNEVISAQISTLST